VAIYLDVASEPCRSAFQLLNRLAGGRPLRVAVRHLPMADVHALALPAAEALEAAGAQGAFFGLLDRLVDGGVPDEKTLLTIAAGCVPDPPRLREELEVGRYRDAVVKQINDATASGARVVPELYIDGDHYAGELKTDALTRALAAKDPG
jgi:protein-disulfide isomerase